MNFEPREHLQEQQASLRRRISSVQPSGTVAYSFVVPLPYRSSAKASIAIVRARLMATVNSRWCGIQFPDMRRGTIRPRSVRKFRSSPMSLKSMGVFS
jgi:hypothetical protein